MDRWQEKRGNCDPGAPRLATRRRRTPCGGQDLGSRAGACWLHGRDRGRGRGDGAQRSSRCGTANFLAAESLVARRGRQSRGRQETDPDNLEWLINNAGIGTRANAPGRQISKDGHELRLPLNYSAGFQLTTCE